MADDDRILVVDEIVVRYGRAVALDRLSLDVRQGEVVAVLGANGAGKTTLLNAVSGFLAPVSGQIRLAGEIISTLPPHQVFRRQLAQISQSRDLFSDMSVLDNLELGAATISGDISGDLERVFAYFPRLKERTSQKVKTLSGGEQQMVAVGRALMGRPKLLLLDEPTAGLSPHFVAEIRSIIIRLKAGGTTMLLVEQNLDLALAVADRYYIIKHGAAVSSGLAVELRNSDLPNIASFYF